MKVSVHQDLIEKNIDYWNSKPLLKKVYSEFYTQIASHLSDIPDRMIVELGSGIGNIHEIIPNCLRTDLFPNPWIDQIENAYKLSFEDNSVTDLILIDVFHHLRYPFRALEEFRRVLRNGGKAILLEPCISVLGTLIYGPLHDEPIGWFQHIQEITPKNWSPEDIDYYSAQGNATRIFLKTGHEIALKNWHERHTYPLSALTYIASGGYSKPQLYPSRFYPTLKKLENALDKFPSIFATRLLIVLEK